MGLNLAISILDLFSLNPLTRLKTTQFKSVEGIKKWLDSYINKPKIVPTTNNKSL